VPRPMNAPAPAEPPAADPSPSRRFALLLALVCTVPLWFSLPSLRDPFGQSEEAVNATIWGLGARNLISKGPVEARLGALVSPYPGAGPREGIYAHHPPLPVWLSTLVQLFGDGEAGPRLAALAAAGLALLLLFRLLQLFTSDGLALSVTAAIATCPYVLVYGRMLTTLTLATPLFLHALTVALRRGLLGERWRWTLPVTLAALVLSSWDGVIGAGAVALYLAGVELRAPREGESRSWSRALVPGLVVAVAVALVGAYLVWANGGAEALVWQFRYRAGPAVGRAEWLRKQLGFVSEGLGWATLVVIVGSPFWLARFGWPRGLLAALCLCALPGMAMLLVFRQGADRHPFWAYNLILPAACALAAALHLAARRPRLFTALLVLLGAQAAVGFRLAGEQLARERVLNARGALLRDYFSAHPVTAVRFVSVYNFFPFASWYVRVPIEVVPSVAAFREKLAAGSWPGDGPIVVDLELAKKAGCAPFPTEAESPERRWAIAQAWVVDAACGGAKSP